LDWKYRLRFDIDSKALLDKTEGDLIFEGLDTHADIYLNGIKILHADNMFRTWNINVINYLKEKDNFLEITFFSSIKYDTQKAKEFLPFMYFPSINPQRSSRNRSKQLLLPKSRLPIRLGLGTTSSNLRNLETS
jgi:beta-galactosidase/beta-glucuronidase